MMHTQYPRGAIFYVDLGEPDGTSRQAGVRPCILISSDINNYHSPMVNVACLTSFYHKKKNLPVHLLLTAEETGLARDSICLCEQIQTVPKTALKEPVSTLPSETLNRVYDCIKIQFGM